MILSDRKKKILQALVSDYIESAEPISSKEIQEKHLKEFSSATIRNELSALESMGYLVQPHVSSGRIPSQKAFRLYVDELMEKRTLSRKEIDAIDRYFQSRMNSVEDIVSNVAKVLTEITNYTSVVVKTPLDSETIKSIRLIRIDEKNLLVVIVTDFNIYKDSLITVRVDATPKEIETAEQWLNKMFDGRRLNEFRDAKIPNEIISNEFAEFNELYGKILEILKKVVNAKVNVITEGTSKILDYPEYNDMQKAKQFLSALETKSTMANLFQAGADQLELKIRIGDEEENIPEDCSVVSAQITWNDKPIGSAGVIGPVRMDYPKVISVLNHISKMLDHILSDDGKKEE